MTRQHIRPRLISDIWRSELNIVDGWVYDPDAPDERLAVALVIDGLAVALSRAETLVQNEPRLEGTDRCFGFRFFLPDPVLETAREVSVELANTGQKIGKPLLLGATLLEGDRQVGLIGQVAWYGGLRLHGSIERPVRSDLVPLVRLYEDGVLIDTVRQFQFDVDAGRHGQEGAEYLSFDMVLPLSLADGLPHEIRVLDGLDRELAGSPVLILGVQGSLSKSLRALDEKEGQSVITALSEQFERLIPGSLPFGNIWAWQTANAPRCERSAGISPPPIVVNLKAPFDPHTVSGEKDQIIVFLDEDATLIEGAEEAIVAAFEAHPDTIIGYGDAIMTMQGGEAEPHLRPAFDYERLRFQNYTFGATFLRLGHFKAMLRHGLIRNGIQSTREVWRALLAQLSPEKLIRSVLHLPRFLVEIPLDRAQSLLAPETLGIEDLKRVLGILPDREWPEVEIIIPTRDRLDLLRPCLETLFERTDYPHYRVLILDNGSEDPETLTYLSALPKDRVTILQDTGPFNYSRLNNRAVALSQSPLVLLLNNDVEILDPHWLSAMVMHLTSAPDIGAVGAKLLWPNRQVQHGGVILGTNFGAVHSHNDRQEAEAGYGAELLLPREASAVTAACLLCRRETYLQVGGLDPVTFPIAFNDVDLCLKFRAAGLRNLWTPFARLLHRESASRGRDHARRDEVRLFKELNALRRKWGRTLMADPYYHPALNLDPTPFTGLALNPRPLTPRFNLPPQPDRSLDPWGGR